MVLQPSGLPSLGRASEPCGRTSRARELDEVPTRRLLGASNGIYTLRVLVAGCLSRWPGIRNWARRGVVRPWEEELRPEKGEESHAVRLNRGAAYYYTCDLLPEWHLRTTRSAVWFCYHSLKIDHLQTLLRTVLGLRPPAEAGGKTGRKLTSHLVRPRRRGLKTPGRALGRAFVRMFAVQPGRC